MLTRRLIGFGCLLSLVIAFASALPGCGGPTQELGPTGEVKSAPGDVQLDKEYEQAAPGKKAK